MPGRSYNMALTGSIYKYAGKELDEESGLNWYYFGARYYDPVIGRWMAVDPAGELRPWESPFCYTGNNPINRIDIGGKYWYDHVLMQTGNRYFPRNVIMYYVNFDGAKEIWAKYLASWFIPGVKSSMLENRGFHLTRQEYFEDIVPGVFSFLLKAPRAINRGLQAYSAHGNRDLLSLIDDPDLMSTFEKMDFSHIPSAVKIGGTWYFTSETAARKAVSEAKKYLNHNREIKSKKKKKTEKEKKKKLLKEVSEDRWERFDPANG